MSEIDFRVLAYGSIETIETITFNFPMPTMFISDVSTLERTFKSSLKNNNSKLRRYIILLLDSIGKEGDHLFADWEENPQVLTVFNTWGEDFIPPVKQTKLYYMPKEFIDLILPLGYVQFLKIEADKCARLDQISLSKIYLRKAQKIKELTMTNIRAEPSHILVIPLNTTSTNLINTIERIRKSCAKFGYSSAIIRTLDEYIPKFEAYNHLPYGKLIFEYEQPLIICRWLRLLCPIRMYLYGNESTISSELSKEMISHEPDPAVRRIVNDDDYCIFIENEPVSDKIKWNFSSRHAQLWQISNLTPLNIDEINTDIRFRSALRRAHITCTARMSSVTAQIFDWFDECTEKNYFPNEFKVSVQQNKPNQPLRLTELFESNFSRSDKDNDYVSSEPNRLIINRNWARYQMVYIWLGNGFSSIDSRFQSLISPSRWNSFSSTNDCQKFLADLYQLGIDRRIHLISTYSLAAQLFTDENAVKISAAYIYSDHEEFFDKWTNKFHAIRGVYKNFDALYEQFKMDLSKNIDEDEPIQQPEKEIDEPLPISFYDTDPDRFQRSQVLIEGLLKSSRTSESKEEMLEQLRLECSNDKISLKQIDEFEQEYHSNAAIQWYTRDTYLYRLINHALRCEDTESIIKYRFFIVDLYQKIDELYQQMREQINYSEATLLTYYRGQVLSTSEVERFKKNIGGLVSFNTFFSTSLSLDIALMFAGNSSLEGGPSEQPVLFCIEIDSSIENTRPYANIDLFSVNEDEDEVLFSMGSVFRVVNVDYLPNNEAIQVINLTMVDENDIPKENVSTDLIELFPEHKSLDPVYVLVGLTSLFEKNEQTEQIKTKFEQMGVQFFENTDALDKYMEIIRAIQSFVVFINSQFFIPERYQQTKLISYAENDMHFNDLVYELLYQMEEQNRRKESMKELYADIEKIYLPSKEKTFYVQLILSSSSSRQQSEKQLQGKLLPSTTLLTFYQTEPCINFLQSIVDINSKLGNAMLILQFDGTNLDHIIDQFEPILSVKFMYICSKHASKIAYRRIIREQFETEDELYGQLYLDSLYQSYVETNAQINVHKNKAEAKRLFEQTNEFYGFFREHQNSEK